MNEEKNFKLVIAEQYEKGELPVLGRKDTFEFACVQCGECCRNRQDILLNPFDIFRLCKGKQMTVSEFFKKYCELYPGESSKLPLAIIKFRPVYEFGTDKVIGTRCPFLGQKEGLHFCRVHNDKPFVCFSYPLGRIQKDKANQSGCRGLDVRQGEAGHGGKVQRDIQLLPWQLSQLDQCR